MFCSKKINGAVLVALGLLVLVVFIGVSVSENNISGIGAAGGSSMDLVLVDDPDAMCNDGTPAAYYYKAGLPDKWVIHVDGGGSCFDAESCQDRKFDDPAKMSSSLQASTLTGAGILSVSTTNNPTFHDWSKVALHYCSSDLFTGTTKKQDTGFEWHFLGNTILKATMQELKTKYGMDAASEVVIAGRSAGATATFATGKVIADEIKGFTSGATFSFIIDSGWLPDIEPYSTVDCHNGACAPKETIPIAEDMWQPVVGSSCQAKYGNSIWKCYYGTYSVPYLTSSGRVFIVQDWENWADYARMGLPVTPTTSAEKDYANQMSDAMISEVESSGASGFFSAACGVTGFVSFDSWTDYVVDDTRLPDGVDAWYNKLSTSTHTNNDDPNADDAGVVSTSSVTYEWLDHCDNSHTWYCSENCPATGGKAGP